VNVSDSPLGSLCLPLQVVLINAVKDVAKALGDLISATKGASGRPHDDPAMLQLKNSAKVREIPSAGVNTRLPAFSSVAANVILGSLER